MGNAKRERRRRAELARSQGSAQTQNATPSSSRTLPSNSPALEEVTFQIRRDHQLDDMLLIARTYHSRGVLGTARKWYEDLLPMAERERGRDDAVTLGIVGSLVEVFHAQGDRGAAVRLMLGRAMGAMSG